MAYGQHFYKGADMTPYTHDAEIWNYVVAIVDRLHNHYRLDETSIAWLVGADYIQSAIDNRLDSDAAAAWLVSTAQQ